MALLGARTLAVLAALALAACGLGGAEGGGLEHLPSTCGGPYKKLPASSTTAAEEPYVIVDTSADLSDPSALAAPGGGFDVWFTHRPAPGGATEIWYAHLPGVLELPDVAPVLALAAFEPWEQGIVEAPSVVDLGGDRRVMYYQGGGDAAPGIGRATSSDGGRTWAHEGMVLVGGIDPAALVMDGHTFLYYGLPDGGGIGLAEADEGAAFVPSFDPVLVPSDTNPDAFDRNWVGEPDPVGGITAANQIHIGLFYVGRANNGTYAIGHAVSRDGRMFVPFFNGAAVLEAETPDDRGPSAVLFPDHGVLFYNQQRSSRMVIAAAGCP